MALSEQTKQRRLEWAKDLESRKYKQTTGTLRDPDFSNNYCCLGVGCNTYRRLTGKGKWNKDSDFIVEGVTDEGFFPEPVAKFFGFKETNPNLPLRDETYSDTAASSLNDNMELSFEEIAKRVRYSAR